jgi:hypothetical protein
MRTLGLLLVALTLLSAVPSIAPAADDAAYARGVSPGNGATAVATAPPAELRGPAPNLAWRLRALHPEAILAVLVSLLLGIALVLGVVMIRDSRRGSSRPSAPVH